jgi:hypothetical protein
MRPVVLFLLLACASGIALPSQCAKAQGNTPSPTAIDIAPDVARIATVLHVEPQIRMVLEPAAGKGAPGFRAGSDLEEQLIATQQVLNARNQISVASITALTDINRTVLLMQKNQSKVEMTAEERAYRNTKFFNAFLGATVGMVGSGLQFSKSQTVNYVGDGISVAGGGISVVFALCTADVSERDNPPDFPPYWDQLPETVKSYLQTDAVSYSVLSKAPPKKSAEPFFSCHFEGGKTKGTSDLKEKEDILSKRLMDMTADIKKMQDAIAP